MASRFPLYTDADVRGPLIEALRSAGWDVVRAIDEMVEGTKDPAHFERAVKLDRVLVTNDAGQEARAQQWYEAQRSFVIPASVRGFLETSRRGSCGSTACACTMMSKRSPKRS